MFRFFVIPNFLRFSILVENSHPSQVRYCAIRHRIHTMVIAILRLVRESLGVLRMRLPRIGCYLLSDVLAYILDLESLQVGDSSCLVPVYRLDC